MDMELVRKEREVQYYTVIRETLRSRSTAQAALMLHLCRRQVFRLKARVRVQGRAGLVHGNRGRPPHNATPAALRHQIITLYREVYPDRSIAHFTETLAAQHHCTRSPETIRRWLHAAGFLTSPRRGTYHRTRRPRSARSGQLLFLDGSPHLWLGPDHSSLTLMLASDDATGCPLYGLFLPQETLNGCFEVLYHVFRRFGLPECLYLDRASHFITTRHGGTHVLQRDNRPTGFQHAMRRLGIGIIFASSPQARGRAERLNRSFQNRLVPELRSAHITSAHDATHYLNQTFIPDYARRFGVPPLNPAAAFRPVPDGLQLRSVLCALTTRVVAHDNTISLDGRVYQLLPTRTMGCLVKTTVVLQLWFDGTVHLEHPTYGPIRLRRLPGPRQHPLADLPAGYDILAVGQV